MTDKNNSVHSSWEAVIGLEVHVQLNTKTKMFTSSDWSYGESPNTQICPITLGYPGTLPTINSLAVNKGILIGLCLNCKINRITKFARKHYFYPDLPKGYQISQFKDPLCESGYIKLGSNSDKKINIVRAHLEEDSGKTIHSLEGNGLIDYNRSGAPLIEIVSGPDISSSEEALDYLNSLKEIIMSIDASDCDMEKGNLRVDLNISVMKRGSKVLGTRREVKNLNSFRNIEKAIKYEFQDQVNILENGGKIKQETLLWDDNNMITRSMRSKEDAHDYRYFPEPDLPPLVINDKLINKIKDSIPELPRDIRSRFFKKYNLTYDQINYLIQNRDMLNYFESVCSSNPKNPTKYYNWIMIDVLKYLKENEQGIENFSVKPNELKKLIDMEIEGKLDHSKAKKIFKSMIKTNKTCQELIKSLGYDKKDNVDEIEAFIVSTMKLYPSELKRLENGEIKLINFFIGIIMKESKGEYSPSIIMNFLNKKYSS